MGAGNAEVDTSSFREDSAPSTHLPPIPPPRPLLPPITSNYASISTPFGPSPTSSNNMSSTPEAGGGNGDTHLNLQLVDLELLHHFSTVTYLSLGRSDEGRHIWQTYAVKVALSHLFLLRGLLSLSALHLSSLKPEQERMYLDRASEHHDKALEEFHAILDNVNDSNVEAAFLFSSLLVPNALVLSRIDGLGSGNTVSSSSIFDWLFLVRGVKVVLEPFRESIWNGILGNLVQVKGIEQVSTGAIPQLQRLREDFSQVTERRTKEAALAYTEAICELEAVMLHLRSSPAGKDLPDVGIIMGWIVKVSQGFSECLRERTPEALIILAHYATTLRYRNGELPSIKRLEIIRHYLWWLHGRDVQLVSAIEEQLPVEWRGWLDWPKSCAM
ncbi:uncharacterized protein PAC_03397 [Phialocephala subalpina]|uniref:C6 finger domain protein n=1 Tax=Phialocephala subalpina TaxID=576137 RepID=A0A1L7WL76_9HELO|nr:uncharacterized protein PAC_03397 [Phialocephala subalpina]